MNSCYSSNKVMEEIKCRIKDKFKNQENFGKELGASRKTVSRILNHGTDIVTFFRICKILGIDGISIDWYSFFCNLFRDKTTNNAQIMVKNYKLVAFIRYNLVNISFIGEELWITWNVLFFLWTMVWWLIGKRLKKPLLTMFIY